jgi:alpha-L-fucosidase 2
MVYGGIPNETIQFNEDTLWTGIPRYYHNPDAHKYLPEIRKLLFDGKQREAEQLAMEKFMSVPLRQEKYQPFGHIHFHFSELFPLEGKHSQYRRELDLDTGIAKVSYEIEGVKYTREVFASAPDQVLVIRLTSDKPGKITFDTRMETPHSKWEKLPEGKDTLIMWGQVGDYTERRTKTIRPSILKFEARLRVITEGGEVSNDEHGIYVKKANAATVVLAAATSYVNYADVSGEPAQRCREVLKKIKGNPPTSVLKTSLIRMTVN